MILVFLQILHQQILLLKALIKIQQIIIIYFSSFNHFPETQIKIKKYRRKLIRTVVFNKLIYWIYDHLNHKIIYYIL
jgi:hypothetical protein